MRWPLVALVAAAADKNKALVVTDPEEKPLYLFGHIPKCGGVSFVADLVQKLRLTSCFGRKAVVAKGENWTHAMERGRCNFVNTEQWQGLTQHFPRPPRVAILVRDPIHHVRSQFAHCQTPGNRAKWRLEKAGLHDWVARWRDAVNGGPVASAFKLCHFNPLNMMTTKLCGGYNHNGLKPKHGWSETSCLEKALEEVATVWHIAPLERYDQSLCVLGLRLGIKLTQCSCAAPVSAFGLHKQHGVKHHAEMSPATVAIVRDLTRSDDAVWRAASERFDRDVAQLSSSCAAPARGAGKTKGARRLAPVNTPSPRPREEKILDATGLLAAAKARAARWNACAARFKDKGHRTDAVVTLKDKMLFVDNVKAGSATVRKRLKEVWGLTWETWERDMKDRRNGCGRGRTTTACVSEAQANNTVRWAVVRDPVAKLESGVRQIWERPGWNRFLSADELLRKQLALNVGKFVDEHFEPNAWRLSGRLKDGRALRLDYVVKLEELDAAWPELAALLVRGARGSRQKTLATFAAPFADRRNHHPTTNRKTHKSSRLSPAMVARLCDSPHFADEWACFDYPRPAVCGNNSSVL
jgi:hypothetical protein